MQSLISALAIGLATLCSTAALSAEAVKIGVLTDMSGAYADASGPGSVVAARMAVEDFGGTLFGRPIEIVSADHQNRPEIGANIARRWYDREGVDMITDLTNSAVAIAVQNLSRERRKIDLVTGTATTVLTNEECSPYGAHWTYDAYALSVGTARTIVEDGGKSWYFITVDYTFGANLEETATREVAAAGGTVLGHALAPLDSTDFSSQLLAAKASGAQVIALANSGADTANSVKQASEFGLLRDHIIAALVPFITDIRSIGLENAQGLILTTAFYWDRDDSARSFGERFFKRQEAMPTMIQAGTYSAVLHYLAAVKSVGSTDADAVIRAMRQAPIHDAVFPQGTLREDGQMVHDMYVVRVKAPSESARDWDFYNIRRTIPADRAFLPLAQSRCRLLKPR